MKRLRNIALVAALFLILVIGHGALALAASAPPTILSYQGRLANSAGDLLGSISGTTYYFKFSVWNNSNVGSGTQVWPASAPASVSSPVRQGVFNVNIGDTAKGYPVPLTLDFSITPRCICRFEVSPDNVTFETLFAAPANNRGRVRAARGGDCRHDHAVGYRHDNSVRSFAADACGDKQQRNPLEYFWKRFAVGQFAADF